MPSKQQQQYSNRHKHTHNSICLHWKCSYFYWWDFHLQIFDCDTFSLSVRLYRFHRLPFILTIKIYRFQMWMWGGLFRMKCPSSQQNEYFKRYFVFASKPLFGCDTRKWLAMRVRVRMWLVGSDNCNKCSIIMQKLKRLWWTRANGECKRS